MEMRSSDYYTYTPREQSQPSCQAVRQGKSVDMIVEVVDAQTMNWFARSSAYFLETRREAAGVHTSVDANRQPCGSFEADLLK